MIFVCLEPLPLDNRALRFLQVMGYKLVMVHCTFTNAMWVGVDNRLGEAVDAVEEAMADLLGDLVGLYQRQIPINLDIHDDMQRMSNPACAYIANALDTWHLTCRSYDGWHNMWVDCIQETL